MGPPRERDGELYSEAPGKLGDGDASMGPPRERDGEQLLQRTDVRDAG